MTVINGVAPVVLKRLCLVTGLCLDLMEPQGWGAAAFMHLIMLWCPSWVCQPSLFDALDKLHAHTAPA